MPSPAYSLGANWIKLKGIRMSYICPHCQKELKKKRSLETHIAKLHPDKIAALLPGPAPAKIPPAKQPSPETLKIETPPAPTTSYHCIDCGTPLEKGQNPCPGCGRELNWGLINES